MGAYIEIGFETAADGIACTHAVDRHHVLLYYYGDETMPDMVCGLPHGRGSCARYACTAENW